MEPFHTPSIISRVKGAMNGAEIKIDGGVLGEVKEKGAPEGTQVEVRELFLIPLFVRNF